MGIIATLIARTFEYGVPRESHERRLPPRGERREARLAPQPRPRRTRRRPRLGRRRRRKQQDVIRRGRCVPFPREPKTANPEATARLVRCVSVTGIARRERHRGVPVPRISIPPTPFAHSCVSVQPARPMPSDNDVIALLSIRPKEKKKRRSATCVHADPDPPHDPHRPQAPSRPPCCSPPRRRPRGRSRPSRATRWRRPPSTANSSGSIPPA